MSKLTSAVLIVIFSILFFSFCRYVIYRRAITAEDARKILLALMFIGLISLAIFQAI